MVAIPLSFPGSNSSIGQLIRNFAGGWEPAALMQIASFYPGWWSSSVECISVPELVDCHLRGAQQAACYVVLCTTARWQTLDFCFSLLLGNNGSTMNYIPKNSCNCNNAAERKLANQPAPWNVPILFQSQMCTYLVFFPPKLFSPKFGYPKLLISGVLSVGNGEWKPYLRKVLFLLCLVYSLAWTISLGLCLREKILLPPFFPNVVDATHLALSRNWHLPDTRNHLCAVHGSDKWYYRNLISDERSWPAQRLHCVIRKMGGWWSRTGLQRFVERTPATWSPFLSACIFRSPHQLGSLWDPGIYTDANNEKSRVRMVNMIL